jgi:uncharacterized PurR-regulated membrane protein YhhQ (DUF165 family)
MPELTRVAAGSYLYKLLIAILITPLIYLAHNLIDRFLEHDAEELQAAERRG